MVVIEEALSRTGKALPLRRARIGLPGDTHLCIAETSPATNARGWYSPFGLDDGLLLHIHLAPCSLHILGDDGIDCHADVSTGKITGYVVRSQVRIRYDSTPEFVALHLSDAALAGVANEIGVASTGSFNVACGSPFDDICIQALAQALLSDIVGDNECNHAFLRHAALALTIHIATRFGAFATRGAISKGGLAPWQLQRAREMFNRDLSDTVSLAAVAEACGVSVSHFSRAFRCSVGVPPHIWLMRRRVQYAKDLMRRAELPLSEIALSCGFADQSHFTRVFSREVGKSPGQWRGALRLCSGDTD